MTYSKPISATIFVFAIVLSGFATNLPGQYCAGYTEYRIADNQGTRLTADELPDLKFVEFDGERRDVSFEDGEATVFYRIKNRNRLHKITTEKEIAVYFGYCGQINDLTLEYKGTLMKLVFEIGINNTNLRIEPLPFQAGSFRLISIKCRDNEPAPMIDNEMRGVCVVPAERWKKIENEPASSPTKNETKLPG